MKRLIARMVTVRIAEREFQPFHMLANSIISQQLSTKAAATIKRRVGALVGVPFQIEQGAFDRASESYAAPGYRRPRPATFATLADHVRRRPIGFR